MNIINIAASKKYKQIMKRKFFIYLSICILLNSIQSCEFKTNRDRKDASKQVSIETRVITNDLLMRIPGDIVVLDSVIFVCDPLATDKAIKAYCSNKGHLIFEGATIGRGPDEILTPSNLTYSEETLSLYDPNLRKIFKYDFFPALQELKVKKSIEINASNFNLYSVRKLSEDNYIAVSPSYEDILLHIDNSKSKSEPFLLNPLEDAKNAKNISQEIQGTIRSDYNGRYISFAAYNTPYLALVEYNDDTFEKKFDLLLTSPKYRLINNELEWYKDNIVGFMDMTIDDEKIYALHSGEKKRDIQGRSKNAVPNTLYEFDFNGNVITIYKLDRRLLRISNDGKGTLYGIALDEMDGKYKIVELMIQ